MSDYEMDIMGNIGLTEYSNIHDYLGVVDIQDNFTITMNVQNEHDVNILNSLLKSNNFHVSREGYDNNGRYFINAIRKV